MKKKERRYDNDEAVANAATAMYGICFLVAVVVAAYCILKGIW